jgi:hypothetical protein
VYWSRQEERSEFATLNGLAQMLGWACQALLPRPMYTVPTSCKCIELISTGLMLSTTAGGCLRGGITGRGSRTLVIS